MARWRAIAGAAVLAALAGFCILLVHPYISNWRLQRTIEEIAFDPARKDTPPEAFAAEVADRAAKLGVPLPVDHIRVTKSRDGVFIDARYFVRVDLMLYTVDLHFRPSAGVR